MLSGYAVCDWTTMKGFLLHWISFNPKIMYMETTYAIFISIFKNTYTYTNINISYHIITIFDLP